MQKDDAPQPIKPPMIERRAFPHNQDPLRTFAIGSVPSTVTDSNFSFSLR
jgi:hypothetical protein